MSSFMRNNFIFALFLILLANCTKTDSVTGEKILIEPNPDKKAREFADKGGGIFGDINKVGKGSGGGSFEFASSNVLWRATLKSSRFFTNA
jgi:hypothetical protein